MTQPTHDSNDETRRKPSPHILYNTATRTVWVTNEVGRLVGAAVTARPGQHMRAAAAEHANSLGYIRTGDYIATCQGTFKVRRATAAVAAPHFN